MRKTSMSSPRWPVYWKLQAKHLSFQFARVFFRRLPASLQKWLRPNAPFLANRQSESHQAHWPIPALDPPPDFQIRSPHDLRLLVFPRSRCVLPRTDQENPVPSLPGWLAHLRRQGAELLFAEDRKGTRDTPSHNAVLIVGDAPLLQTVYGQEQLLDAWQRRLPILGWTVEHALPAPLIPACNLIVTNEPISDVTDHPLSIRLSDSCFDELLNQWIRAWQKDLTPTWACLDEKTIASPQLTDWVVVYRNSPPDESIIQKLQALWATRTWDLIHGTSSHTHPLVFDREDGQWLAIKSSLYRRHAALNPENISIDSLYQGALQDGARQCRLPCPPPLAQFHIRKSRPLRVLSYRWHVPHQYELYKQPWDFFLVSDFGDRICGQWDLSQRPLPANATICDWSRLKHNDYDLAILHFDENVLSPQRLNGVLGIDHGMSFRHLIGRLDIPTIAVCHGSPPMIGEIDPQATLVADESDHKRFIDLIGDTPVVVNSYQAQKEWGFHNSHVIWHGFDPGEFQSVRGGKGILSLSPKSLRQLPHNRGLALYLQVAHRLASDIQLQALEVPEPHIALSGNLYAQAKFYNYVNALGDYSVYFNPTQRSPMPRSRGEAMMMGLAIVTTSNHDVHQFIRHGVNGYVSDDPEELADILAFLSEHADIAENVGRMGRKSAMEHFHIDRYTKQWHELVSSCCDIDTRQD